MKGDSLLEDYEPVHTLRTYVQLCRDGSPVRDEALWGRYKEGIDGTPQKLKRGNWQKKYDEDVIKPMAECVCVCVANKQSCYKHFNINAKIEKSKLTTLKQDKAENIHIHSPECSYFFFPIFLQIFPDGVYPYYTRGLKKDKVFDPLDGDNKLSTCLCKFCDEKFYKRHLKKPKRGRPKKKKKPPPRPKKKRGRPKGSKNKPKFTASEASFLSPQVRKRVNLAAPPPPISPHPAPDVEVDPIKEQERIIHDTLNNPERYKFEMENSDFVVPSAPINPDRYRYNHPKSETKIGLINNQAIPEAIMFGIHLSETGALSSNIDVFATTEANGYVVYHIIDFVNGRTFDFTPVKITNGYAEPIEKLNLAFYLHGILPAKIQKMAQSAGLSEQSINVLRTRRKYYTKVISDYAKEFLGEVQKAVTDKLKKGIKIQYISFDGQWSTPQKRGKRAPHNVVSFFLYLSDGSRYVFLQQFSTKGEEWVDLLDNDKLVKDREKVNTQRGLKWLFEHDIVTPIFSIDGCKSGKKAIDEVYGKLAFRKYGILVRVNKDKFHFVPKRKSETIGLVKKMRDGQDFIKDLGVDAVFLFYNNVVTQSEVVSDIDERISEIKRKWNSGLLDFVKSEMGRCWKNSYNEIIEKIVEERENDFDCFFSTSMTTTDVEVYHSRFARVFNKAQGVSKDSFEAAQRVNAIHHQMVFDMKKEMARTYKFPIPKTNKYVMRRCYTEEQKFMMESLVNANIIDRVLYGEKKKKRYEELLAEMCIEMKKISGRKRKRETEKASEWDDKAYRPYRKKPKKR